MSYDQRMYQPVAPPLTKSVKYLIIACVACFVGLRVTDALKISIMGYSWVELFGLIPGVVVEKYWVWQFVTYIFQHTEPMHLFFNMLSLWFFGADLEMRMGKRGFITYFFLCGIGGGVLNFLTCYFTKNMIVAIIGASGGVYGLLVAYGMFFSERTFYLLFLFPIKAKHFVLVIAGLQLLLGISPSTSGNVAHFAHLGGMLVGAVYIWLKYRGPFNGGSSKRDSERERLRKQFTLIVNQGSPKGEKPKDPYWN